MSDNTQTNEPDTTGANNQDQTFTQEQVEQIVTERLEEYKRSQPDNSAGHGQPRNREAKYRIRAKEAEAERDALRESLTRTRRSILKTQDARLDPHAASDLFDGMDGEQVNELFQDDGTVDADKLARLIGDLLEQKPYLRRRIGIRNQTGTPTHQRNSSGWEDSF